MQGNFRMVVLTLALLAPVISYAQQSNTPPTRADVKAELVRLEQAGYRPGKDVYYPKKIQAAEARLHALDAADESYGGGEDVHSATGAGDGTAVVWSHH